MKKIILAALVALPLAFAASTAPAEAHTGISIYFGMPFYNYRPGPDYRFRQGYGWYQPRYYGYQNRLSCGEARNIVRDRGYRNVRAVECNGRTYTFQATYRGMFRIVYVNARTGAQWRG